LGDGLRGMDRRAAHPPLPPHRRYRPTERL